MYLFSDITPTANDVSLTCEGTPTSEGQYNVALTIELNDTFNPAVLSAISSFDFFRIEYSGRNVVPDGEGGRFEVDRVNETFIPTFVVELVNPLPRTHHYEYEVIKL